MNFLGETRKVQNRYICEYRASPKIESQHKLEEIPDENYFWLKPAEYVLVHLGRGKGHRKNVGLRGNRIAG